MPQLNQCYGLGQALIPTLPPPIPFQNAPTSAQDNFAIGQIVYTPPQSPTAFYMYRGAGNWIKISDSDGPVESVTGTTNQITVTPTSGDVVVSLPSAITAPGSLTTTTSLSATTTVTAGTGITATTGDITATTGNLVVSGTAKGVSLPVTTGSGAASGTVNCNGRVGSVTFTGVSVAQNADITLTMGNTSITGASTRCVFCHSGATTNSALTVKSYTPSANQVVWVITNGGTATSTANITFDFIVLN